VGALYAEKLLLLPPAKFPSGDLWALSGGVGASRAAAVAAARGQFEAEVLAVAAGGMGDGRGTKGLFIFCSFSKTFKVTPAVFGAWVSILRSATLPPRGQLSPGPDHTRVAPRRAATRPTGRPR
jgi:hypothetical protein